MTPARTIGASDVPLILGLSQVYYRDASVYDLWARIMGWPDLSRTYDDAQMRGFMLEPGILLRMSKELGPDYYAIPNPDRHPFEDDHPWRHVTPDGFLGRVNHGTVATLECKAFDNNDGWGKPGTDEIRPDVAAQVMWQQSRWGCDGYVGLAHGYGMNGWGVYRIPWDQRRCDKLATRVRRWWDRHIVGGWPPEIDGSEKTARAIGRVYRATVKRDITASVSDKALVQKIRAIDEHLAGIREKRHRLRNELRARMGVATRLVDGRRTLANYTQRPDGVRSLIVRKE